MKRLHSLIERLPTLILMVAAFVFIWHAVVWAQVTSSVAVATVPISAPPVAAVSTNFTFTVPSFTFTVSWHWLVVLWNLATTYWPAIAGLVVLYGPKILDGYEAKYPWLSPIVMILENLKGVQNVTPLAQRGANAKKTVQADTTAAPVLPPAVPVVK
jgi:hypothetical protein